MNRKAKDPFDGLVLDSYEQEIEDALDKNDWQINENMEQALSYKKAAAANRREKEKR